MTVSKEKQLRADIAALRREISVSADHAAKTMLMREYAMRLLQTSEAVSKFWEKRCHELELECETLKRAAEVLANGETS